MPAYIDGIRCFAPRFAHECADYPKEFFAKLAALESSHFWFRSRNVVIRHLVEKYLSLSSTPRSFLEIGCGTGYVLKMLADIPGLQCTGAEIHLAGALIAKSRVPSSVEIIQLDATELPFENEFTGIGAFDVLEHIVDDEIVMQNVYRALKSQGSFFITVPQHRFLWSFPDDFAGHKRRYTRTELVQKLTKCGFTMEFVGSFCVSLFPLMLLVRLARKKPPNHDHKTQEILSEFAISPALNWVLRTIMRLDEALIKMRVSMPFGGSLAIVARKQ